jgi:putative phosphoribosyl transferase
VTHGIAVRSVEEYDSSEVVTMVVFADRVDAGRRLARSLQHLAGEDVIVLGLPRGGVPVAAEVADALHAPLDVVLVRKLGVPVHPELAMGAIGEGGVRVLDQALADRLGVSASEVRRVEEHERRVLDHRSGVLRRGRAPLDLRGRTAIVVDDGVATGSTARVACHVARELGARRVVLAAPVGPPEVVDRVPEADEVVVLATPAGFRAVGAHYRDFAPTSDAEVVELLDAARRRRDEEHRRGGGAVSIGVDRDVVVPVDGVRLGARLTLPVHARGVVAFAHGSGSGRHSPRNQHVARTLVAAGVGTMLLDLLTPEEEAHRANVFDIALLSRRLRRAGEWLAEEPDTASLPLGYFGASTGAGAALAAAATQPEEVRAVVSRGGRPDLAGDLLALVRAPTLLIVGGRDEAVLELNVRARALMHCPTALEVVPTATHLFEEPGTLEEVAQLAAAWFRRFLRP